MAVAADLDGDGDSDLGVGFSGIASPTLLLGNGDGTFGEPVVIFPSLNQPLVLLPAFGEPRSLAEADIDGDGDTDLGIVYQHASTQQQTLLIHRNDGNWKFGIFFFPLSAGSSALSAQDLNDDGRPDLAVASLAKLSIFLNETRFAPSRDCNLNTAPDECDVASGLSEDRDANGTSDECEGIPFHRGDPNVDGTTDISDAIALLGFLFRGGAAPSCLDSADTNDDGRLDISDGIGLLNFLFRDGASPAPPGPTTAPCGVDPQRPGSLDNLGCDAYPRC